MKAVIVELRGTQAAALTGDGSVRKMKNRHYSIGQTVEIEAQKHSVKLVPRILAVAATIAVIVLPACAYYTPYAYVSLDVNPAIEYSLNRFDRVLSYAAVNGEGEEVLENLSLKNKKIQEAIKLTLCNIVEEGYLSAGESGGIVIAASCKDTAKSEKLAETLAVTAEATAEEEALDVEIEAESVGQERVQQAKELGVTPGKLNLIEKLQQSAAVSEEITTQDWLDKSVQEIMEQTKENKKTEGKTSGNGSANSEDKGNSQPQAGSQDEGKEQGKGQDQQQGNGRNNGNGNNGNKS